MIFEGQVQIVINRGREGMQRQGRGSQETMVQLWAGFWCHPGEYIITLLSYFVDLRPSFRWRMTTLSWAQDSWDTPLSPHHQPSEESHTLCCTRTPHPTLAHKNFSLTKHQRGLGFLSINYLFSLLCPTISLLVSKFPCFRLFGFIVCQAHKLCLVTEWVKTLDLKVPKLLCDRDNGNIYFKVTVTWESKFLSVEPKNELHKHTKAHGSKRIGLTWEEESTKLSA